MKRLLPLFTCLLLLTTFPVLAIVAGPTIVERIFKSQSWIRVCISRGTAAPETVEYQLLIAKLYAQSYVLQGTFAGATYGLHHYQHASLREGGKTMTANRLARGPQVNGSSTPASTTTRCRGGTSSNSTPTVTNEPPTTASRAARGHDSRGQRSSVRPVRTTSLL